MQDYILLNDTSASESGSLDVLLQTFTYITYGVRAVFRAEKDAHATLNRRRHASVELRVCACVQKQYIPTHLYATVHTAGGEQSAGKRACKLFSGEMKTIKTD